MQKNQVYTVAITGYTAEGLGVARVEGQVVFVHGAVRGEVCGIRILKVLKNAAFARVEEILERSPARQETDCPQYPACGGCDFRHISYQEELEAKRQRVEDALRRLGGAEIRVEEILGSPQVDGYRNKGQFPVSPVGKAGFFRGRSHDVIPALDCRLQTPQANAAAKAVEGYLREFSVPAYDEKSGRGLLRHIYTRTNRDGQTVVCLVVNGVALPEEPALVRRLRQACPEAIGIVLNSNRRDTNVVLGDSYRTLWGTAVLEDTLCGLTFRLSVPSFYQVNRVQAERLYEKAVEFAGLTGRETVLDLYCGIGTISLILAKAAAQVIGVEVVAEAVLDAEENARRNGIENVRFWCGDAGDAAARFAREGLRPEVIVVDPPRKGLCEAAVAAAADMGPERIVYVSCDPGTLARDVKRFREAGYAPTRCTAVDMFPRTRHVETVVLLSKGEIDSQKVRVEFSLEDMDMSGFKKGATYAEIKAYVLEKYGLKVSSLYIAQIKEKLGIKERECYNRPKSKISQQPQCPPEKEGAIRAALVHFGMV